jgi:tRNA threonylcarbamoyladenosine biosynthesis protein TsaE
MMNKKTVCTESPEATQALAEAMGRAITSPITLLLEGPLGSGKTTFTQGLARGLDIQGPISSPSFTLLKSYTGRLELNHMDAYRIETKIQGLGFDEVLNADGVSVIEWPEFLGDQRPQEHLLITFESLDETRRKLSFRAVGVQAQALLEHLP